MYRKIIALCLLFYLNDLFPQCYAEPTYYMNVERPTVVYFNPLYVKSVKLTSRRISHKDPRHYFNMYLETLIPLDNNVRMDFYFHQFLTNRYQPSFVELHFGLCDMIDKDPFFGAELKRHANLLNVKCPYPPAQYNLTEMVIPFIPKNFPFNRGRIIANVTMNVNRVSHYIGQGYIDMEIKQKIVNKNKQ